MRRVIAPVAAALLALTIAGPVAADPIDKPQFPTVYVITCEDPTLVVPDQYATTRPGWDVAWAPGNNNTPWILMYAPPPGLVAQGRLIGPCDVAVKGGQTVMTDAYFFHK